MNATELFNEIRDYCQANSNEVIVKKYSRYFKEGYDAYGLTFELLETKVEDLITNKGVDLKLTLETANFLIETGKYEETSFAILLLKRFKKQFTQEVFNEIDRWFDKGVTNWGHCDVICSELIAYLLEKKIISFSYMSDWRTAPGKFKRRAVPVSLIKMLKYTNDYQPFYDFIDPMMSDPYREVHQGLGWFLREAWKKQPETTEMFLMKWKDLAPRLIFQYATEKMSADQKNHFKRTKIQR